MKCLGPDIKKTRTNNNRPRRTRGPVASLEALVSCGRAAKVELLADILILLKVG
jgi:hypothetical protein